MGQIEHVAGAVQEGSGEQSLEYELTYGELVSANVAVRSCTFDVYCVQVKGRKVKASRNTQYICCLTFNLETLHRYREKTGVQ
jgi:hypothetical protein